MSKMTYRDTIQEYIDLWADMGTEDERPFEPSPPPLPPKDSVYIRAMTPRLEYIHESHYGDHEDIIPISLDLSEDHRIPFLHQIQTTFGSEDLAETPSSVYSNPFSASADYTTIAQSNPFSTPKTESPFTSYSSFSSDSIQHLTALSPTPPPSQNSRLPSPQPLSSEAPKIEFLPSQDAPPASSQQVEEYLLNPRAVSPAKFANNQFFENPRPPPVPVPTESDFPRPVAPLPVTMPQRPAIPRPVTPSIPVTQFKPMTPSSNRVSPDRPVVNSKAAKMLGIELFYDNVATTALGLPQPVLKADYSRPSTSSGSSSSHSRSGSTQIWSTANSLFDSHFSSSGLLYDAAFDAACIYKALRRGKKVDTVLLSNTVLVVASEPYKLPLLRRKYRELYSNDVFEAIAAHVHGNKYKTTLLRLLAGPDGSEAQWLSNMHGKKKEHSGLLMDDKIVIEALFCKEREEIASIKQWFLEENGVTLEKFIEELYLGQHPNHSLNPSYSTALEVPCSAFAKAVIKILTTDREYEPPVKTMTPQQLRDRDKRMRADIEDAYKLERRRTGNMIGGQKYLDFQFVIDMLITRPLEYLKELCIRFEDRHGEELVDLIEKHMKKDSHNRNTIELPYNLAYALSHTLQCVISKPTHTAKLLDETMKSLGLSNDNRLIARTVRMWFDRDSSHVSDVRKCYQEKYGRSLEDRVGKVSGKGNWGELMKGLIYGRRVGLGLEGHGPI